jgi:hypothetical protein
VGATAGTRPARQSPSRTAPRRTRP